MNRDGREAAAAAYMRENSSLQFSATARIYNRIPALCGLAGRSVLLEEDSKAEETVAVSVLVAVVDAAVPALALPSAQGNRPCEPQSE